MIGILNFEPKHHLNFVRSWLMLRKMDPELANDLPQNGFMITVHFTPVAAGFLRRMEGSFGMIDAIVTNPEASGLKRHQALETLWAELFKRAEELGIRHLMGTTSQPDVLKRVEALGFQKQDDWYLVKDLRWNNGEIEDELHQKRV